MGTNYYLYGKPCPTCGHSKEERHIGKSSGGWCFALHVCPEDGIHDRADWEREWRKPGVVIKDEYDNTLSPEQMIDIIMNRKHAVEWDDQQWGKHELSYSSEEEFHRDNSSERGPNGLARARIDGEHCIGHGAGTWDLIKGYFS